MFGTRVFSDETAHAIVTVLQNALLVVVARTALSGLYMGMNIPCVFANFSKSLKGTRKRKLHDSLWYVTWHTVRYVNYSLCIGSLME